MKVEIPFKTYMFITFLLFIVITIITLTINSYLDKKFPEKDKNEVIEKKEYQPEEIKQTKAILGLALLILIILLIIFIVFKITMHISKTK